MRADELITKQDLDVFMEQLLVKIKQILKTEDQTQQWLRATQVRKMLKISASTLQSFRLKGLLPATKIGSTFFYNANDIEEMMIKGRGKH